MKTFTVGLFAIGLDRYWSQFDGLYEQLEGYREADGGVGNESSPGGASLTVPTML
ncbi:hypothetical protein D3C81_2311590 [compost metagenome]